MSLWQELSRRKVLQVAAAYIVVAWLLLQVAVTLEDTLELPAWFDRAIFASLLIGFPVALILAWAYEVVPDGGKKGSSDSSIDPRILVAVISLFLIAGAYSVYSWRSPDNGTLSVDSLSIAVLPFADMSPEGDQSWFADGISEEILNVLAKTKGLQVASRTSSFKFRGEETDIKTVADELGVALVLEGSVRSQEDRLRITAQLINASDGFHLWSETFDRRQDDIFEVQEEISTSIARALFGELGIEALPAVRSASTQNLEAYTHYLRGREYFHELNLATMPLALSELERAVALDKKFVDAWSVLARAERMQNIYERKPPAASHALKRALSLDPDNGLAASALAQEAAGALRWLDAEQLFLRSIGLSPNEPAVHFRFASFLRHSGRTSRALEHYLMAKELGGDQVFLTSNITNIYAYLGRFAEARAFFEKEVDEHGLDNTFGQTAYFVSLLADGMESEAREFAATMREGTPAKSYVRFYLDRLDGNADAGAKLVEFTMKRIQESGLVRWSDIDRLLQGGDVDQARKLLPETVGYGWSVPPRMIMHINDEIDPRYLPYRPNMLLLIDMFPGVPEAFMDIGVDVMAEARARGLTRLTD